MSIFQSHKIFISVENPIPMVAFSLIYVIIVPTFLLTRMLIKWINCELNVQLYFIVNVKRNIKFCNSNDFFNSSLHTIWMSVMFRCWLWKKRNLINTIVLITHLMYTFTTCFLAHIPFECVNFVGRCWGALENEWEYEVWATV